MKKNETATVYFSFQGKKAEMCKQCHFLIYSASVTVHYLETKLTASEYEKCLHNANNVVFSLNFI